MWCHVCKPPAHSVVSFSPSPSRWANNEAPKEIYRLPRRFAEGNFNIVSWTELPKGGHFLALEQPQEVVNDLRKFKRLIDKKPKL